MEMGREGIGLRDAKRSREMAEEPVWLAIFWVMGSGLIRWPNPLPCQMPTQVKIIFSEISAQVVGDQSGRENGFYGH